MVRINKLMTLLAAAVVAVAIAAAVGTMQVSAPTVNAGADAAVVAQATSTPVAPAVAPLGNKFVRSFKFDNTTKSWLFYDPRVPQASTQRTFDTDQSYWILVSVTVESVNLGGKTRKLTCVNGNCWNLMVW